jgi:hypothetical protein
MITGDFEGLKTLAAENECAEHHMPLTVAWDNEQAVHYLRCGKGHPAIGIVKPATAKELITRGELYPAEAMTAFLPRRDLATGTELTAQQQQHIIAYARKYELDPYRGHVVLMYGQPYIGLDGYIWHAHRVNVPVNPKPRPMTADERKEYQVAEGDYAWICTGSVNNIELDSPGIGIVRADELTEMSKKTPTELRYPVVAKHPQLLAQKRAEWQWFRRAFPIGEEHVKEEGD